MDKSDFNIQTIELQHVQSTKYHLAIHAIGFEARAIELLKQVKYEADHAIAFGFNYGQTISYADNLTFFRANNVKTLVDLDDSQFERDFHHELALATARSRDHAFRLLVDISCFNRTRLAAIISSISVAAQLVKLEVDFFYAVARFSPPSALYVPNSVVGPIHSLFSGWSRIPANPTAAVIGLGYEQGQALGVVEYLQANPVWVFSPTSGEFQYTLAVSNANTLLLEELPTEQVVTYQVEKPCDAFQEVEGLARGLLQDYNVVLVPFGPKIFVLTALLVAWRHRSIAVWRVSPGTRIDPVQREASGHYSTVRLITESKVEPAPAIATETWPEPAPDRSGSRQI